MDDQIPPIFRLLDIMARLRNPDGGCPWDIEQTFATIAPHTIEEAYEVADAIERDNMRDLKEELGDLLLQVVFHAQMADEANHFNFDDVVDAIVAKLIDRHPHVFGHEEIDSAEAQTAAWEAMKQNERQRKAAGGPVSALDGVARGFPALMRAQKLQKRAARVGFDWPDVPPVMEKLHEELNELDTEIKNGAHHDRLHDELGDVLFTCVNLARHLGLDPEGALRHANEKFLSRFKALEEKLQKSDENVEDTPLARLDALWNQVKAREKKVTGSGDDTPDP